MSTTPPVGPAETFPDDLEAAILDLKDEQSAVLLAHYYQESEVQDLADFVGDSLALAQAASRVDKEVIVFCGVNFMAETAKILNPDRKVVVPDLAAQVPLRIPEPPGWSRFPLVRGTDVCPASSGSRQDLMPVRRTCKRGQRVGSQHDGTPSDRVGGPAPRRTRRPRRRWRPDPR